MLHVYLSQPLKELKGDEIKEDVKREVLTDSLLLKEFMIHPTGAFIRCIHPTGAFIPTGALIPPVHSSQPVHSPVHPTQPPRLCVHLIKPQMSSLVNRDNYLRKLSVGLLQRSCRELFPIEQSLNRAPAYNSKLK
jgi:hypothetical protein